jgi:N-acetylneuraminate lyase
MAERIEGLLAASFTPMTADGGVNLDAVADYGALLARSGAVGAFVCGTTGESLSLTVAERMRLAERWAETAPDGFRLVIHVGHTSIEDARALARHAAGLGVSAIAAMGPCFFRPRTVEDLVVFCAGVAAAAANLPFYYYHIPAMTGVAMPMVGFLEAAADRIPTLAGVKYTWEDLHDFGMAREAAGGRFDILYGRDESLLAGLALGARGAVGSSFNFAAPLYARLIEAFDSGDLPAARRLQATSRRMIRLLYESSVSYLPAAKAVMKMVGVDCGPVRPPLRPLTPDEAEAVRRGLDRLGFDAFRNR